MNNLELLTNREVYKPNKVMAIDLDDTVLDLNGSLIEFHNLKYGTSLKYEDIDSFDLAKIWGCTHEESISLGKFFIL